MTILMEALGYQNYNGVWYTIGQEIPVTSELDASDMVALRLAKRKTIAIREAEPAPAEVPAPPQPVRREMVPYEDERNKNKGGKKRYAHREMRVDKS